LSHSQTADQLGARPRSKHIPYAAASVLDERLTLDRTRAELAPDGTRIGVGIESEWMPPEGDEDGFVPVGDVLAVGQIGDGA
jgi:hypothetical protein